MKYNIHILYLKKVFKFNLKLHFIAIATCLAINTCSIKAQNSLPMKDVFSLGGGIMGGLSQGKGDYMDIANKPVCFNLEGSYKHFFSPIAAFGGTYEYITSSKEGNKMCNHYIAPTITLRYLMDQGTNAVSTSLGTGLLLYSDRVRESKYYSSISTFNKAYFCVSWDVSYDVVIARNTGMQFKFQFLFADWHFNPDYTPKFMRQDPDDYQTVFDNNITYISLGIALQFGK